MIQQDLHSLHDVAMLLVSLWIVKLFIMYSATEFEMNVCVESVVGVCCKIGWASCLPSIDTCFISQKSKIMRYVLTASIYMLVEEKKYFQKFSLVIYTCIYYTSIYNILLSLVS